MNKLTDFQLKLLSDAAQRDDGIVALPADFMKPVVHRRIARLLAAGLLEEVQAPRGATTWCETDGERHALCITPAGLAALGIDASEVSDGNAMEPPAGDGAHGAPAAKTPVPPRKESRTRRSSTSDHALSTGPSATAGGVMSTSASAPAASKQAQVIGLLRKGGATIPDLMAATGWQAHSVRGFLSGTVKKKFGLPVVSQKEADGERRYHIGVFANGERDVR